MIIGAPKTIDDLPPFSLETVHQFELGMNAQIAGGTPLELPVAMPLHQLAQTAKTLKVCYGILVGLSSLTDEMSLEEVETAIAKLKAAATELIETPTPLPVVQPATSRLILPK
jgi:hypothetical protein